MRAEDVLHWPHERRPDGAVVLCSPDGGGAIYLRPGVRPLRSLHEIVQRVSLADPVLRDARVAGPIERVVTDRAEHGALLRLRTCRGRSVLHVVLATVVGDGELVLVEARSKDARIATAVRRLVRAISVGAAPDRVRMFVYQPPAGWFGVRRALATCWLAPRYPRDPAVLVACDAIPRASSAVLTRELLWPSRRPSDARVDPVAHAGLEGVLAVWGDGGLLAATAELEDDRFRYRLMLQHGTEAHLATVRAVVATIEPVPRERRPQAIHELERMVM